jgi:hypothetical protein
MHKMNSMIYSAKQDSEDNMIYVDHVCGKISRLIKVNVSTLSQENTSKL